jgi:Tol biopolymer transport system component
MTKNLFYPIILFIVVSSINACMETGHRFSKQNFSAPEPIEKINNGFKPRFAPDGRTIIYTNQRDEGLYIYDETTRQSKQISSERLSGFELFFNDKDHHFCYVEHDYSTKRRMSRLNIVEPNHGSKKTIVDNVRQLKILSFSDNKIFYLLDEKAYEYDLKTSRSVPASNIKEVCLDNELNLILYEDGDRKVLNPAGKQNYLWPSFSPDKTRVLYAVSGKDAYIFDLKSKRIISLGRLHAPSWSPDGKWIVGMDDYDDGERFTKSDITLLSVDGLHRKNLTEKLPGIALYPSFSPGGGSILFNDEIGKVFRMKTK